MHAHGTLFGADFFQQMNAGSTNLYGMYGLELDSYIATGASANIHTGLLFSLRDTHAQRGTYTDAAITFGDQSDEAIGWQNGILFGGVSSPSSWNTDSCLICLHRTLLPLLGTAPTVATGLDLEEVNIVGNFYQMQGAAVDGGGNSTVENLIVAGAIGNVTAGISSITINSSYGVTGGVAYYEESSWPTITIQASPGGGTQAAATVATMRLNQVLFTPGTDVGCSNNDVITPVGDTGTEPQITLTVAGGAVTAAVVTAAGSLTATSATHTFTGGTCSTYPSAASLTYNGTATFSSGAATITVTSATGQILQNTVVSGAGIPPGTIVNGSVTGTCSSSCTVPLSQNTNATVSAQQINFDQALRWGLASPRSRSAPPVRSTS